MMIRQRSFRIGQRVKLHDLGTEGGGNAYPLPPGWHHGDQHVQCENYPNPTGGEY